MAKRGEIGRVGVLRTEGSGGDRGQMMERCRLHCVRCTYESCRCTHVRLSTERRDVNWRGSFRPLFIYLTLFYTDHASVRQLDFAFLQIRAELFILHRNYWFVSVCVRSLTKLSLILFFSPASVACSGL